MGGDVLRRKSVLLAFDTLSRWNKVSNGKLEDDPYYSFDFIMTQSEKRGLKSSFYFLPSGSPEMEIQYPVTVPQMQSLLQTIDRREHKIGIHGFYGTYLNSKAFTEDVQSLQDTLEVIGIGQEIKGGRQHYLQWQNPETFVIWENAGMKYDSTLSFADMPGFRCGTCYEYSVYDCITRRKLKLKEKIGISSLFVSKSRKNITKKINKKFYKKSEKPVDKRQKVGIIERVEKLRVRWSRG